MPQPVYATAADYLAHTGVPLTDTRLLVRASRRVDTALIGAVYPVDTVTKLPTEAAHIEALRDAVCEQVRWWDETGDATGSGASEQWSAVSIGNVRLARYVGEAGGSRPASGSGLSPDAMDILRLAGLLPISPQVWG